MRIELRGRTSSSLGRWAGMAQWPRLKVIRCTRRSKADADADSDGDRRRNIACHQSYRAEYTKS